MPSSHRQIPGSLSGLLLTLLASNSAVAYHLEAGYLTNQFELEDGTSDIGIRAQGLNLGISTELSQRLVLSASYGRLDNSDSDDEIDDFAQDSYAIGLTYDLSHAWWVGIDWQRSVQELNYQSTQSENLDSRLPISQVEEDSRSISWSLSTGRDWYWRVWRFDTAVSLSAGDSEMRQSRAQLDTGPGPSNSTERSETDTDTMDAGASLGAYYLIFLDKSIGGLMLLPGLHLTHIESLNGESVSSGRYGNPREQVVVTSEEDTADTSSTYLQVSARLLGGSWHTNLYYETEIDQSSDQEFGISAGWSF